MREVVVHGGTHPFAQDIKIGPHQLNADEPTDLGGGDTGPSPYDLLLSALGACTSMTLRMYADRKKWSLDGVTVRLKHEKIHARDCEECDEKVGRIDKIERNIQLEGDLTENQRQRLLEIANKCPVHRTLNSTTQIHSRLIT